MKLHNTNRVFERSVWSEVVNQIKIAVLFFMITCFISLLIIGAVVKAGNEFMDIRLLGVLMLSGTVAGSFFFSRRAYYTEPKRVELKENSLVITYFSGSTREVNYSSIQGVVYKKHQPMLCMLLIDEEGLKTGTLLNGAAFAQRLGVPAVEYAQLKVKK